jgi:uncharacterized membrane protein
MSSATNESLVNRLKGRVQDMNQNLVAKSPENQRFFLSPPYRRGKVPGRSIAIALAVPAMVALGLSAYLAWISFTQSKVPGCDGGLFNCDHVLTSKYSKFLGVPVAVFAAVTYSALLGSLAVLAFSRKGGGASRRAWLSVNLLGLCAGIAALWFIGLQVFALGHLCKYCLFAHSCGLFIAATLFAIRPFEWKISGSLAGVALASVAVMGVVQSLSPEPVSYHVVSHDTHANGASSDLNVFDPNAPNSLPVNVVPGSDIFGAPVEGEEEDNLFDAPIIDDASIEKERDSLHAMIRGWSGFLAMTRPELGICLLIQEQDQQESGESSSGTSDTQSGQETPVVPEQEERRLISIRGGAVKLDVRQWPMIGSPEAKHVFVEMFDYACPHCRNTHRAIKQACETMGEELAVIVLPVPLNPACNPHAIGGDAKFAESCELSRLAVACWRIDPCLFCEFHHWMFEGPSAPRYADAKAHADGIFGKEKLDEELAKKAPGQYISKHAELYNRVGKGTVPKLLFPRTSVEGEMSSGSALVDMIRREAN